MVPFSVNQSPASTRHYIRTYRLRHDAAHVYTSVISCVVKCKKWVGQQPRCRQEIRFTDWKTDWPRKPTSRPSFIPTLSWFTTRKRFIFLSVRPVIWKREEKQSILWIYALCLTEATALSILWLVWNIFAYCAPVRPLWSSLFCQGLAPKRRNAGRRQRLWRQRSWLMFNKKFSNMTRTSVELKCLNK